MSRSWNPKICIFSLGSFPETYAFRNKKNAYTFDCSRSSWTMWGTSYARYFFLGIYKGARYPKRLISPYSSWYRGYTFEVFGFRNFPSNSSLGGSRMRVVRNRKSKIERIWFYICSFWRESSEDWDGRFCDGICPSESVKENYIASKKLTRKQKINNNTICSVERGLLVW